MRRYPILAKRPIPLSRLIADRRGATVIEYGLIIALVVLAIMGAIGGVADATTGMWYNVSDKVTKAG